MTLNLSVPELPLFHLQFSEHSQLRSWERVLSTVNAPHLHPRLQGYERDPSSVDDEERKEIGHHTMSSADSSFGTSRSTITAPARYSGFSDNANQRMSVSLHAPIDLILAIPVSSSMHGIKMDQLRDSLRFLLHALGPRDRMGLVAFGSSTGVSQVAGLTTSTWPGWQRVLESLRAANQKGSGGDLVEGANVAMDLLMQRKTVNPVSAVLIISDSSTSENENIDFVVQRAEAAKYVRL